MSLRLRLPLMLPVALALFVAPLFSQEFRASLSGSITDPAGAAITDAKITVQNVDTGEAHITTSRDDGTYTVISLTPGKYVITVEKQGFKREVRQGAAAWKSPSVPSPI